MIKFILDYSSSIPIYRQIIDQIRFGIASGQLVLGEQLPTVRSLAVELKVNLNTVSKAYKELEIKNVLTTQQGTGTFINSIDFTLSDEERSRRLKEICSQCITAAHSYGFSIDDIIKEISSNKETNV